MENERPTQWSTEEYAVFNLEDNGPVEESASSIGTGTTVIFKSSSLEHTTETSLTSGDKYDLLTKRQKEVLGYITEGKSNSAIAQALTVETGTVKNHVHQILTKLQLQSRVEVSKRYRHLRRTQEETPIEPPFDSLSPREIEILKYSAAGYSARQIADRLVLAPGTIKNHRHHIMAKLRVNSTVEAVNLFFEHDGTIDKTFLFSPTTNS